MLESKNVLTWAVVVWEERHAVVFLIVPGCRKDIVHAASSSPRAEPLAEQGFGHQEAVLGDPAHRDEEKQEKENLIHLDRLKFWSKLNEDTHVASIGCFNAEQDISLI